MIDIGIDVSTTTWTRVYMVLEGQRMTHTYHGPGHADRAGMWCDRMREARTRHRGRVDRFINTLRSAGVPPTVVRSALEEAYG